MPGPLLGYVSRGLLLGNNVTRVGVDPGAGAGGGLLRVPPTGMFFGFVYGLAVGPGFGVNGQALSRRSKTGPVGFAGHATGRLLGQPTGCAGIPETAGIATLGSGTPG